MSCSSTRGPSVCTSRSVIPASSRYSIHARANALENNVVAYKMVNGKRTDLKPVGAGARAYGVQATVAPRAWHTIRVDFKGPEFVVRFDKDVATFTVRDETLKPAGRVGV